MCEVVREGGAPGVHARTRADRPEGVCMAGVSISVGGNAPGSLLCEIG